MKINADSFETFYVQLGQQEALIRTLDQEIRAIIPDTERYFFVADSITMIAFGRLPIQTKTYQGTWPLIGIAPQKNHVSLYVSATRDNDYLAEIYAESLGKVKVGKSCIRIKKIEDVNRDALKSLIIEAVESLE